MAAPAFTSLSDFYTTFTPSDLVGTTTPDLGTTPNVDNPSMFNKLRDLLENNGRGVLTASDLVAQLQSISTTTSGMPDGGIDLSNFIDFYSTAGTISSLGPNYAVSQQYVPTDPGQSGTAKALPGNPIQLMVGGDYTLSSPSVPKDITMVVTRSPFFSPMTRNAKRAEVMLNSMPSPVLASLAPFLQVEFMITRSLASQLQTPGLLKFLMGAIDTSGASNPQDANDAMIGAHQIGSITATTPSAELDYAGMEMFTAPQTLTNPQPNVVDAGGTPTRYADVIDPYRPFASLEHATVSIVPAGAGFYTYKKATLQIKIHDRSRLNEISDLIRPRVYTGVTIWMTYGWRAPTRAGDNPYFDYINNNMLMREAYGITNSNFSFDNVGQVTLTLELFTKGVHEMRESKISSNNNDATFIMDNARRAGEQIADIFAQCGLDPTGGAAGAAGLNRDTRAFQVLDAAEQGQRPDPKNVGNIAAAIQQLNDILANTKSVNQAAASTLITTLKKYYDNYTQIDPASKFALSNSQQTQVTQTIAKMFNEVTVGVDPFLPTLLKTAAGNGYKGADTSLQAALSSYNQTPKSSKSVQKNTVVSFGKLFSVFALRNLDSMPGTVDELQFFFYQLNEQCGPISCCSVAQFPIDLDMFLDQYREHVIREGGENLTLESFLSLVVNAQFLDPRAIGYGMKSAYQPYDPKNPDAKQKDKQGNQPSQLDAWFKKWGTFKQPTIEMYIEVSHQRPVDDSGTQSDILQLLNYSAKDATTIPPQQAAGAGCKRIMRIHIYDKQLNPYKGAATLLKDSRGTGYIQVPAPSNSVATEQSSDPNKALQYWQQVQNYASALTTATVDPTTGAAAISQPASYQQAKDIVSQMVPTIRYGANGTTITTAHLASKADPLLSTIQMQRTMTIRNDAAPNGGGETGFPIRVIPAQLQMTTLGNPLATMAQMYFIDFQTGTTLDNLYIVTGLVHTIGPGKFETNWTFGYADAYGAWEGAQGINQFVGNLATNVPKGPGS